MGKADLDFPLWVNDTKRLGTQITVDESRLIVWVTKDALHRMGCRALPNEVGVRCRTQDWLPVLEQCRGYIQSIATRKKADGKLSPDGSVLIGESDVNHPPA